MTGKTYLPSLWLMAALGILTFAIPAIQWLVSKLAASTSYSGLISSILIITGVCLWYGRSKALSFLPASPAWRVFCYLGCIVILSLLIINIQNGPVSRITGQARLPFEVFELIILLSIAEELVFRGVIRSIFERLFRSGSGAIAALAGTSLLFGLEHLGYWAQTNWPLPGKAFLHALSMVGAGISFGSLRLASRSLAVPIAVHMLANGVILLTQ